MTPEEKAIIDATRKGYARAWNVWVGEGEEAAERIYPYPREGELKPVQKR